MGMRCDDLMIYGGLYVSQRFSCICSKAFHIDCVRLVSVFFFIIIMSQLSTSLLIPLPLLTHVMVMAIVHCEENSHFCRRYFVNMKHLHR